MWAFIGAVTSSAQETSRGLRMLDSASAGRPTPVWTIQPVQGEHLPRSKSPPRRKGEAFLQRRCKVGQALMFMLLEMFRSFTCTSSSSLRLLTILAPSPLHLQSPISPLPSEGPWPDLPNFVDDGQTSARGNSQPGAQDRKVERPGRFEAA